MTARPEPAARLLRIHGHVQGVGYRNAFHAEARRLGLDGWVRNRSDGSVEALVAGPPAALEAIVAWSRLGPPAARVDDVSWQPADTPPQPGFASLATV